MGLSHMQTLDDYTYQTVYKDEQWSTAYITNESGLIENCYQYDAFGNLLERKEQVQNRILYNGQQYDQETGQYYLRGRYCNPVIGRFTQEDIYRGDGLNLYAYCANNPVMYYDPSGYAKKCPPNNVADVETGRGSRASCSQDIANRAAQEYNAKYNPTERAINKGYTGVTKTANGGVSFEGTPYMHRRNGVETKITIPATGSRSGDFDLANSKFDFDDTPDGYVWHHLDDYNVENNTFTLELVLKDAHNASKPHSGACAQYDAVHGPSYNPARKGGK